MNVVKNIYSKIFQIIVITLVCFVIFLQYGEFSQENHSAEVSLPDIQAIFSSATSFEKEEGIDEMGKVFDQSGKTIGYFLNSSPYADNVYGFAGPVPMLIGLDNEKRVIGVRLLANGETSSFIESMKEKQFFKQWDGKHVDELSALDIDAVSGATLTSSAIIESIKLRSLPFTVHEIKEKRSFEWINFVLLGPVFLLALVSFLFPKKLRALRIPLLISNILILGFHLGNFISLKLFFNWIVNGISMASNWSFHITVLSTLLILLFTNKSFYCTYLCPFGAAQELLAMIPLTNVKISVKMQKSLKNFRTIVLLAIMFFLTIDWGGSVIEYEPFSAFLFDKASLGAIIIAISFLIVSIILPKFWCKYVCPTGELLNFITKKNI